MKKSIFHNQKRYIFLFSIIYIIGLHAVAQIPDGYYQTAQNKTGYELKTALYNIIKGHSEQTYSALWVHFKATDAKPNGKVWDIYSDVPNGTPPYEYTFTTNQCGNYSVEGDCYNREHSWPKSWFNDAFPMYTDLFHLYPTDGKVNGDRGNYPFGEVATATYTSKNGSKRGASKSVGYSGIVFEPIDAYKGDLARSYFYMATRYENVIASWETYDSNGDAIMNGTSNQVFEDWYITLLLKWNSQDPVSQKEIDRNNAIYNIQGNRNPFIDHNEYVNLIWGNSTAVKTYLLNNLIQVTYNNELKSIILYNCSDIDAQEIQLTTLQGMAIAAMGNLSSNATLQVNASYLKPGIYLLHYIDGHKNSHTTKLIVK